MEQRGSWPKQWFTMAFYWATVQLPNYNNSEEAIVMQLLTLMKQGKAADWAQPHLEQIISQKQGRVTSLVEFTTAFNQTFNDPNAAQLAARQLAALKQDGSVADYNTAFENLRSDHEWNEPTLKSQYKWGLQHWVKTQVAFLKPYPDTLQELQEVAAKIRNLFTELDASCPT